MSAKQMKEQAQDTIIAVLVNAALAAEEKGFTDLAKAIRKEAARIAKRYGLSDVPGLPETREG